MEDLTPYLEEIRGLLEGKTVACPDCDGLGRHVELYLFIRYEFRMYNDIIQSALFEFFNIILVSPASD